MPSAEPAPSVSVIIPCFNVARYVAEALDSLFAQTNQDFEAIVVNDGSPDTDALEVALRPYMERIVYIKQQNKGLSGARNTAIKAARGRYFALLDADDMWEPDYLECQLEAIESRPDVASVYPDAMFFGDDLLAGKRFMQLYPSEGAVTVESVCQRKCNIFGASIVRMEAARAVGFYDEDVRYAEDLDFWLRLLKSGFKITYIRHCLYRYRARSDGLTASHRPVEQGEIAVLEKFERSFELTESERAACSHRKARTRAEYNFELGKRLLRSGDVAGAINALEASQTHYQKPSLRVLLLMLRYFPRTTRSLADLKAWASNRGRRLCRRA